MGKPQSKGARPRVLWKLRAALAPWFDHPSLQGLLRRRISVVATEADRSSSDDRANDENAHDSLPRQNCLGISIRRFEAVSDDLWDTTPAQRRSQEHPILSRVDSLPVVGTPLATGNQHS